MALQTCANPPAPYDSSVPTPRPNFLASRQSEANRDELEMPASSVDHAVASDSIADRPATSEPNDGAENADEVAAAVTPTARVAGTKRKATSRRMFFFVFLFFVFCFFFLFVSHNFRSSTSSQ